MLRVASIVLFASCVVQSSPVYAQNFPSVGFRNDTKSALIVQGFTIVNGVHRRGAPLILPPGRSAFDIHVPPGARFYTVYDANQPALLYLRDFPVVLGGGDVQLLIRPSAAHPARVELFHAGP